MLVHAPGVSLRSGQGKVLHQVGGELHVLGDLLHWEAVAGILKVFRLYEIFVFPPGEPAYFVALMGRAVRGYHAILWASVAVGVRLVLNLTPLILYTLKEAGALAHLLCERPTHPKRRG